MTPEAIAATIVPTVLAVLGALALALRRWARSLPSQPAVLVAIEELRRELAHHAAEERKAHEETRELRAEIRTIQEARVAEAALRGAALERVGAEMRRLSDLLTEPDSDPPPPPQPKGPRR